MLRATGRVVRTDVKSGNKLDTTSGEMRAWSFTVVKLLVAEQDITEVTMFGDSATPVPGVGDDVDWAVTANARAGRLNVQLDQPWAQLFPSKVPVPAGSHAK